MRIRISISGQTLDLVNDRGDLLRHYRVSTARNGAGEQSGSYRTPRGRHLIRARIGAGAVENTVFVRRRPTGEIWSRELAARFPGRDWILTRILWLSGCQPGFNRLGGVDTMRRYIYLHGSPETVKMGTPGSIGCVRMHNQDIVELFDLVPVYTSVDIVEYRVETGEWPALATAARLIREAVFIREQGISADEEWDEHDNGGLHTVAYGPDDEPVGTGRLLPDGRIGRMAVLPAWRGKGVGGALLERLMASAKQGGTSALHLHAQTPRIGFYQRHGFEVQGAPFLEVGIPHVRMIRSD